MSERETEIAISPVEVLIVRKLDGKQVHIGIADDSGSEYARAWPNAEQWDAFVAAGYAALGRPVPTSAPLAERIATEQGPPVDLSGICSEGREEDVYGEGYAKGRADAAAMAREQGATVPRAAVEALRATFEQWLDAPTNRDARHALIAVDALLAAPTTQTEKG